MVEPDNLVLEYLRAIRGDMTKMATEMHMMRIEMTAMRHVMTGHSIQLDHDHTEIADLKTRVDRIEKRLDLVD
jgi:hypothetical protein